MQSLNNKDFWPVAQFDSYAKILKISRYLVIIFISYINLQHNKLIAVVCGLLDNLFYCLLFSAPV